MSTIQSPNQAPFERQKYDLVVGNVPWKRDGLPNNIKKYCQDHGFAQEKAQAFLWKVRDFFVPDGKIALISTSKVLFNNRAGESYL